MKVIHYLLGISVAVVVPSVANATPVNLITDSEFSDVSTKWTVLADKGGKYTANSDSTIQLTSGSSSPYHYIIGQNLSLSSAKTYKLYVKYKTGNFNANARGYAGFSSSSSSTDFNIDNDGGQYTEITDASSDYTVISATSTADSKSVMLGVGGAYTSKYLGISKTYNTITYTNPWVIEVPEIYITYKYKETVDGVESSYIYPGNKISLSSSVDGYDLYYQIDDEEAVKYSEPFMLSEDQKQLKVWAYFEEYNDNIAESTYEIKSSENMMALAISGYQVMTAPTAPWYAYNTSSGKLGNGDQYGDGWQVRNSAGSRSTSGESSQLFLRWDTKNSTWLYAYKLSLEANHQYTFSVRAATNDGKNNDFLIGFTQDLSTVKSLSYNSTYLSGSTNNNDVFNNGVDISAAFATGEAGDYYLVFDRTNMDGNVIIRTTNYDFRDAGEVTSDGYAALLAEAQALLLDSDYANVTGEERRNLSTEAGKNVTGDYAIAAVALQTALDTFKAAKESYDSYVEALTYVPEDWADKYKDATSEKISAFKSLLNPTAATAAAASAASLPTKLRAMVESNAIAEGLTDIVDCSDYIIGASASAGNSYDGWTLTQLENYKASYNFYTLNDEPPTMSEATEDAKYYYDVVTSDWDAGGWSCVFSQTLESLPVGQYRLSAMSRGSKNLDQFKMYAGKYSVDLPRKDGVSETEIFGHGWDIATLDFLVTAPSEVSDDGSSNSTKRVRLKSEEGDEETESESESEAETADVTIGIIASATALYGWASYTDFKLVKIDDIKDVTITVKNEKSELVAGSVVTIGEESATTDSEGRVTLTIADGDASDIIVTGEGHYTKQVAANYDANNSQTVTVVTNDGNLMYNALEGTVGSFPTNWSVWDRSGTTDKTALFGHPWNGDLRDVNGTNKDSEAEVSYFFIRWDDANDYDRYYTYELDITKPGVYDFSMNCVEWSNYSRTVEGQDSYTQLQDRECSVRVSIDNKKGYDFKTAQGFTYDMNTDNQGNTSDKSQIQWIPCTARFFVGDAGRYYISISGTHALFSAKDFSLTRNEVLSASMTEQPGTVDFTITLEDYDLADYLHEYVDEEYAELVVGSLPVTMSGLTDGTQLEYMIVDDQNYTYRTWEAFSNGKYPVYSGDPNIYYYQVVDGVHGVVKRYDAGNPCEGKVAKATPSSLVAAVKYMEREVASSGDEPMSAGVAYSTNHQFFVFNTTIFGFSDYNSDELSVNEHQFAAKFEFSFNPTQDCKLYWNWKDNKGDDFREYTDDEVQAKYDALNASTNAEGSDGGSGSGTETGDGNNSGTGLESDEQSDSDALTVSGAPSRRLRDEESTDGVDTTTRGSIVENGVTYTEYLSGDTIKGNSEGTLNYVVVKDNETSYVRSLTISGVATAVEEIATDAANAEAVYYNLNGIRVSAERLAPGIYIVRNGNKTYKVIVK